MTENKPNNLAPMKAGDTFHCLQSGLTVSISSGGITRGAVLIRSQNVVLTAESILENQDRNGDSFLDSIDDPEAQIKRWGRVMIGRGEFPASESVLIPGSLEHIAERERRRVAAWKIPDEEVRAIALQAVQKEFGSPKSGQISTKYFGGF
ncbi:hypothetical protein E3T43_00945 [Cryobacterium sp. Hh7]|uniref:hypothetical protein n=1 Tax=Cryobacterium sp. Hh7 TaxID=1259159 RepID=UPI00106BADE9|nr:hypothetical protein [Cryobacterium sp. Hh7]TFD61193.1 hypothetical protein E3T43_00945 [Cryobacterium sp. Hh7]